MMLIVNGAACYGKKYCISRNLAKENSLFNSIFLPMTSLYLRN